jgi:isoquinoline 1-oxidoreductase subunit beta
MNLNRRTFLKTTTAVGGGLMIGSYLALDGSDDLLAAGSFEPNIWIKINSDDTVRIMLSQLEMGQGVMTSMPMLVAEELDMDWAKIKTEWTPADAKYGNPNFGGQQLTAGSNSVRGMWKILRGAGATARAMIVTAAAQTWNVPENSLTTAKGVVLHKASSRRATYGSLVDKAAALPVPKDVKLKDPKNFTLMGKDIPRLDIPEKVNGSAVFGMDVKLPGLMTARVARSAVFGGKVKTFNDAKAKAVPGVKHVVQISNGVAVVADNYYSATRGIQALEVTWDDGPNAALTSADIIRKYAELAQKPGKEARKQGDADAVLSSSAKKFERVFEAPFLAHATMEPMNATADVKADSCDVYVPTQGQTACHMAAIAASGLPMQKVKIHTTYLGGGFGRRGEADYVTEAVEISKAVKAPVKVIWSREDDMQHDFYRPISYARMSGAVDASGKPTVFTQHLVQQSLMKRLGSLPPNGVDFISVDGSATLQYDIPNIKVEYTEQDPGIPYGFWRSVGASFQGFAVEAFVDELASTAGKDPYQFRHDLLAKAPRHRAALDLAAEKAGWGKPLPQGRARGIAMMEAFGSILAQVTEVSVDAKGAVKVHRVVCTVDCGWVINPDTIRQQMEGGIVYGLSAALKGEITIDRGRVVQRHFNDYQVVRHQEMPVIEVHIVPSVEEPGGIGEPSTALAAGSLVNAIYAATGKRIYKLPVRPEMLTTKATA